MKDPEGVEVIIAYGHVTYACTPPNSDKKIWRLRSHVPNISIEVPSEREYSLYDGGFMEFMNVRSALLGFERARLQVGSYCRKQLIDQIATWRKRNDDRRRRDPSGTEER